MSTTYTYNFEDFENDKVAAYALQKQVEASDISSAAIEYIVTRGNTEECDIVFDGDLSSGDEDALDTIVANHDGEPYIFESEDITTFLNSQTIVEDPTTNLKGPFNIMQILMNRRELFNDSENPIYDESLTPILGESGYLVDHAGRINSLETIHGKLGWHNQEVQEARYQKPQDLLVYYGWLNSFNSGINQWNNEKVAQEMAKYNLVVFGDGIQNPSHGDYSNTQVIIPRIKALNPNAKIFGYVTVNQSMSNFEDKVDQWEDLEVDGIFMDEAGYGHGTVETNGRVAFNNKVDYVHAQEHANTCFANAWNMDHVLGIVNDPSYPNSTWNSSEVESNLISSDWCLLESFPINTTAYSGTGGYESKSDWATRGGKAQGHRSTYGINLAAIGIIDKDDSNAQDLFDFLFTSSLMFSLDASGSSDTGYGASSAQVPWLTRPDVSKMGLLYNLNASVQVDTGDADVYWRYVDFGRFKLDFSSSTEDSAIEKW